MTDARDNATEAAGRIAAYLGACANQGLSFAGSERGVTDPFSGKRVVFTLEDLRAVLADNRRMREQIDGLDEQWAIQWTHPIGDEIQISQFDTQAAAREIHASLGQLKGHVVHRLVGEWRQADEEQA